MKLLYITNGITGPGGLERVLSVKASALADNFGYEVHIAALNEPVDKSPFFTFSPKVKRHTFEVIGKSLSYVKNYQNEIKRLAAEVQPDIILVCDDGLKGFFVPRILGKKCTVFYERHASVQIDASKKTSFFHKIQHIIMQIFAGDFDKFIVLTKGNLKEWRSTNLVVIPNPLSFISEHSADLKQKKVVSVGSLGYNKGTDILFEIWKTTSENFPDWTLNIFGRDSSEGKYESLAKKMDLKRIFFNGTVKNIEQAYLTGSIFVLPSRSEGFGMVLIEAMNCGLPVISFDCPHGPADIIDNAKTGYLVENGNVAKFSTILRGLIDNFDQRVELGIEAKKKSLIYSPEHIVAKWDMLFKEFLKK